MNDENKTDETETNNANSGKSWDVTAIVLMVLMIAAEAFATAITDQSVLELLPPVLVPFALALAASIRLRAGRSASS